MEEGRGGGERRRGEEGRGGGERRREEKEGRGGGKRRRGEEEGRKGRGTGRRRMKEEERKLETRRRNIKAHTKNRERNLDSTNIAGLSIGSKGSSGVPSWVGGWKEGREGERGEGRRKKRGETVITGMSS